MAKVPNVDMPRIMSDYTQYRLEEMQNRLKNDLKQFQENHSVLSLLVKRGLCKPDVMEEEAQVKWGTTIRVNQSQLIKVRDTIGNMSEDGKRLLDAKKRLIVISLKPDEFPLSKVRIEYVRKYSKEDEAKHRCKIKSVLVEDAREARPARYETHLVCE